MFRHKLSSQVRRIAVEITKLFLHIQVVFKPIHVGLVFLRLCFIYSYFGVLLVSSFLIEFRSYDFSKVVQYKIALSTTITQF